MRKFKNQHAGSNAIDPATTTARNFGFGPVPKKGGKTGNYDEAKPDKQAKADIRRKGGR